MKSLASIVFVVSLVSCGPMIDTGEDASGDFVAAEEETSASFAVAVVAGGCFWGIESAVKKIDGVLDTHVGYAGGTTEEPTYEQVSTGQTGHAESVKILYDPGTVTYERLIVSFLHTHNPTIFHPLTGYGSQYRSVIFWQNQEELDTANRVIDMLEHAKEWDDPILTTIEPAGQFWMAEEYHQDYFDKQSAD